MSTLFVAPIMSRAMLNNINGRRPTFSTRNNAVKMPMIEADK